MEEERDYVIPTDRLPFSPAAVLLDRLSPEEREQACAILARIGDNLRRAAEGDASGD